MTQVKVKGERLIKQQKKLAATRSKLARNTQRIKISLKPTYSVNLTKQ